MTFSKLSKAQQAQARRLRDRAFAAGLTEATDRDGAVVEVTVSRIARDLHWWTQAVAKAEQS